LFVNTPRPTICKHSWIHFGCRPTWLKVVAKGTADFLTFVEKREDREFRQNAGPILRRSSIRALPGRAISATKPHSVP
jgi:hypothetical protein